MGGGRGNVGGTGGGDGYSGIQFSTASPMTGVVWFGDSLLYSLLKGWGGSGNVVVSCLCVGMMRKWSLSVLKRRRRRNDVCLWVLL